MSQVEPLDCQTCGACCRSSFAGHVPVTGADHARLLPAEQRDLTEFRGNRCFMRIEGGACVALAGEGGRWACTIYERRPQVCRDYERGGPSCVVDREKAGFVA